MTMYFYAMYSDQASVFIDTRVSITYNGANYVVKDGFEKVKHCGNKIIGAGGFYKLAKRFLEEVNEEYSIDDIQRFVKQLYKGHSEEFGVYILNYEQDNYYMYQLVSSEDFKVYRDKLSNNEVLAAGAHTDEALERVNYLTRRGYKIIDAIIEAYNHVSDEKVGGELIHYTLNKNSISKQVTKIRDDKPLNYWFWDSPALHADMTGKAKFKKLQVTDGNNILLMDSEKKKFYANEWDMIGLGAIDAELLAANMLSVQDGIISNLTAGKLSTLTNAALNDWSNYIRIEGNSIKYITGKVKAGSGVQKTLPDGRPLYWESDKQTGLMTVEPTPWPVLVYEMDEKVKQEITFEGSGDQAEPKRIIGLGDGTGGSKAIESKYKGGYRLSYGQSNTGNERSVDLADNGITINSVNEKITITGKQLDAIAMGGSGKFGNDKAYIEMTPEGKMIFHAVQFDFVNN